MNPVNSVLCYFIYAKIFTYPNFSFVEKVYDKIEDMFYDDEIHC